MGRSELTALGIRDFVPPMIIRDFDPPMMTWRSPSGGGTVAVEDSPLRTTPLPTKWPRSSESISTADFDPAMIMARDNPPGGFAVSSCAGACSPCAAAASGGCVPGTSVARGQGQTVPPA